jgi:RecG-like helicase
MCGKTVNAIGTLVSALARHGAVRIVAPTPALAMQLFTVARERLDGLFAVDVVEDQGSELLIEVV